MEVSESREVSKRHRRAGLEGRGEAQMRNKPRMQNPRSVLRSPLPRLLQNSPTMPSGLAVGICVSPVRTRTSLFLREAWSMG